MGRHGGTMRCEPPTPGLLRDAIDGLRALPAAADPIPDLPRDYAGERKRLAAVLAGYSRQCPPYRYAVVFTTSLRPLLLPINGGRDADLYAEEWRALRRLLGDQSDGFRDPELWARDDDHNWYVAL